MRFSVSIAFFIVLSTAELIPLLDAVLPQTQCGLCGHPAGCLPYATAMANGDSADGCVPGGQPVADELARILQRPALPAQPSKWSTREDGRPQRIKAVIREDECIGCTKCISACPVDAIIGSGKLMHSIIADLCTGCELCIPPCPVDCIDLIEDPQPLPDPAQRLAEQNSLRLRYQKHVLREQQHLLTRKNSKPTLSRQLSSVEVETITGKQVEQLIPAPLQQQGAEKAASITANPAKTIQQATLRSQIKKLQRQLAVRADAQKQAELQQLEASLRELMESHA